VGVRVPPFAPLDSGGLRRRKEEVAIRQKSVTRLRPHHERENCEPERAQNADGARFRRRPDPSARGPWRAEPHVEANNRTRKKEPPETPKAQNPAEITVSISAATFRLPLDQFLLGTRARRTQSPLQTLSGTAWTTGGSCTSARTGHLARARLARRPWCLKAASAAQRPSKASMPERSMGERLGKSPEHQSNYRRKNRQHLITAQNALRNSPACHHGRPRSPRRLPPRPARRFVCRRSGVARSLPRMWHSPPGEVFDARADPPVRREPRRYPSIAAPTTFEFLLYVRRKLGECLKGGR
jgi:hypothetical protein